MFITKFVSDELSTSEKSAVWDILCACDRDFYPPLSARESSTQSKLTAKLEKMGFTLYATLENDRGAGIHTVYYGKDFSETPSR